MYLREKPLLEKIRQMRTERDKLDKRMQEVLDENQRLRNQLQQSKNGEISAN